MTEFDFFQHFASGAYAQAWASGFMLPMMVSAIAWGGRVIIDTIKSA